MTQAARARQRATVRRLAAGDLSNRAIARKVGVSESTVRRWRTDDAPRDAGGAAPVTQAGAPCHAPLVVPVDADMADHLAVLAEAGHDVHDAVRACVELVADAYRYAWDYGLYLRGVPPEFRVRVRGDALPVPRARAR